MIKLIGIIIFFNHIHTQPVLFDKPFSTMEACEAVKARLDEMITPVSWMDAKLECVRSDWM